MLLPFIETPITPARARNPWVDRRSTNIAVKKQARKARLKTVKANAEMAAESCSGAMRLAQRAYESFYEQPKYASTTAQVERSSAGVYVWLRWAGLAGSLGICNADGDGTARGVDLFHFTLAQHMAGSTESTGGLRLATDEGSKELQEDDAIR